jgi:hypothetical protein
MSLVQKLRDELGYFAIKNSMLSKFIIYSCSGRVKQKATYVIKCVVPALICWPSTSQSNECQTK